PAAGVDFTHLLWRLAHGEAVIEVRGRPGVAWMHLARDAVAAGQERLARTTPPPDHLRPLGPFPGVAGVPPGDPRPGLVELPLVLTRVLARRLRARVPESDRTPRVA